MDIVKINIASINPAPYNPRKDLKPTDPEYIKLKNSIHEFGYVEPIIVNKRNNVIIGGHQRYKVLKDLGYSEIDVVYVDLDDAHEKSLNIALNKISGDWDAEKLEDLIREIDLDDSINTSLTGFDRNEIDELLGMLEDDNNDDNDNNDEDIDELSKEFQEPSKEQRDIKVGDLFKLGKHKLLCGDSYKEKTYDTLVGSDKPDLIFTDPPYLYKKNFGRKNYNDGINHRIYEELQNYNNSNNIDITKHNVNNISYLLNKNIDRLWFFCNNTLIEDYLRVAREHKYISDIHVWCKTTPPFCNNRFYNDIEYMIHMHKEKTKFPLQNKGLAEIYKRKFNKDDKLDVPEEIINKYFYGHYHYISSSEVAKEKKEFELEHPTVKPLKLIIPKIRVCTVDDSIVVDMFSGSGSVMIACEKLGLTCYAVELNPKYMNETINRWEALTGQKAQYLGNVLPEEKEDTNA